MNEFLQTLLEQIMVTALDGRSSLTQNLDLEIELDRNSCSLQEVEQRLKNKKLDIELLIRRNSHE